MSTEHGRSQSPSKATPARPSVSQSGPRQRATSPGVGSAFTPSFGGGLLGTQTLPADYDLSKVRTNAKGGVLVTPEEIQKAFSFLDVDNTGKVTLSNLKKRLGVFFPEMTAKEYRFLMNSKKELSLTDLTELVMDNELTNFDPVYESFKVQRNTLRLLQ